MGQKPLVYEVEIKEGDKVDLRGPFKSKIEAEEAAEQWRKWAKQSKRNTSISVKEAR